MKGYTCSWVAHIPFQSLCVRDQAVSLISGSLYAGMFKEHAYSLAAYMNQSFGVPSLKWRVVGGKTGGWAVGNSTVIVREIKTAEPWDCG